MKSLKFSFYVFIAVTMFFFISSPNAQAQKKTLSKNIIIYSNSSNVGPLNPHAYSPNQMFAQTMVFDALVETSKSGEILPSLAERWEISTDGLVYTFHLRPNVKFSDGEPFNAEAVVKNFEAIMANKNSHLWLGIVNKIKNFEATAPLEFKLTLNEPYYPSLTDLSLARPFRFLSPKAFQNGGTASTIKAPIGTGPWKLVETSLGEYDLFEKNEHYWATFAKADQVLVKVIADPISRALAFETGEINFIYGFGQINFDIFKNLQNTPNIKAEISKPINTMSLAINTARGATSDINVRKALQHAVNKADLIQLVTLGTQTQADNLFAKNVPFCNIDLPVYDFNTEKAIKLLEESGWVLSANKNIREKNGQKLTLDFSFIGNDPTQKAIGEVLQAQYLNLGIDLQLIGEEDDSFYKRQKTGEFNLVVNPTWGAPYEPHAMVASMLVPSHADFMAQSGLPNKKEIDEKINKILNATNEDELKNLYKSLLTQLNEAAVYLPLYYESMFLVYKEGQLKNVHFGMGEYDIPFKDIQPE